MNINLVRDRLTHYAAWIYLRELDCCICIPHKNGGSSFRRDIIKMRRWGISDTTMSVMLRFSVDRHGPFYPEEVDEKYSDKEHFLSVRHPINRFTSLWGNKCRDRRGFPRELWGMTPDELMDYIETHEDRHWRRQSNYATKNTTPIHHDELLQKIGVTSVLNATRIGNEDVPIRRILDHYADDLRLWEDACLRTNIVVESAAM